ncbi:MAG: Ig-like domain-containing protein [Candidatus Kapabacteria bacterium]|nr:Ig-like domain-containing protein [Ignavibacteriota bacterium]MCW5885003.1 Ig-like domain-containing protein [Candidatus Kapabacteria bacterium]
MRSSNISLFRHIIYILVIFIVISCANVQPPSGGPPDTTPPEIVEIFPENQTINFNKRTILLKFSKYMERGGVLQNISVSPNVPVKYSWSGKTLKIELPEDLDSTVTYSVTLGTEYKDLYNNMPEKSFSLIFSAGSKIDSGFIAGKVYDNKPAGAYIFAYNIDNINPDTLNPAITKPDYKLQLGTSGEFRIPALKDATYRFFAIRDQFKNDLFDSGDDFATGIHDLKVVNSKSEPTILKIGLPKDDIGPTINQTEAVFGNYIRITFSEPVNPEFISKESFKIISENKQEEVEIISAALHFENKSRVEIITKQNLDTGLVWNVICRPDAEFAVRDTVGNMITDSTNAAKFRATIDIDTSSVKFLYTSIKDSSEFIQISPEIEFIFDKSININDAVISLKLLQADNNSEIDCNIIHTGGIIKLIPAKPLADSKWFRVEAEMKQVASYSNNLTIDTAFSFHFKTLDLKVRGNVSGVVEFEKEICDYTKYIILKHINGKDIYSMALNDNNEWSFKHIETGDYTAEVFCDVNEDGKYSYGNLYPFQFSEPFVIFENEIKVKPRWTLENVILKVKDTHEH